MLLFIFLALLDAVFFSFFVYCDFDDCGSDNVMFYLHSRFKCKHTQMRHKFYARNQKGKCNFQVFKINRSFRCYLVAIDEMARQYNDIHKNVVK